MAKHQIIGGVPILSQESILAAKHGSAVKLMVHQFIAATQPGLQPPELPALQAIARIAADLRQLPPLVGFALQQSVNSLILSACYSQDKAAGQLELMKAFLLYMLVTGRLPRPEAMTPAGDVRIGFDVPNLGEMEGSTDG